MARIKSVQQKSGIVFGRWKLHPLDDRNWELCRLRDDGSWKPLGRYYSYNTIHLAIQYAADCALKDKAQNAHMELMDALQEYRAITEQMVADVRDAMGGAA